MRFGILLFLFFTIINLKAQQSHTYTFRHIDQTDGLLHNNVFGIRRDAKGFMWILTPNGLQRYDGSRFVNYQGIVNNAESGVTDGAELYADNRRNEIWVMKKNVIEKLALATNQLETFSFNQVFINQHLNKVIYRDEHNKPFLLGEKGVFEVEPDTKAIITYNLNINSENYHENNILVKDTLRNATWVILRKELLLFDWITKRVYSKNYNPQNNPLLTLCNSSKKINPRFIMEDSKSNCWIATWGNMFYKLDNATGKTVSYNLATIQPQPNAENKMDATMLINGMYEDAHSNIWFATENAGLLVHHLTTGEFEAIRVEKNNRQNIQYNYKIYSVTQDKSGNIWLGTDKGISIFNPYRQYFKSIQHKDNEPSVLKSEIVNIIQTKSGNILVGTWGGGIAVYDDKWNFKKNILFTTPYQYNMIWSFAEQDDGMVWAGCQHGYIHIYNPVIESVNTIRPPEFNNSTIRCMLKDRKGNIWFGLHNGQIAKWDKQQKRFYSFNNSSQNKTNNGLPIFDMFIDRNDRIWVSTEKGFKEFDPTTMMYSHVYLPEKGNVHAISGTSCQGIEAYDDSTLLIGTIYGGINFFNTRTKQFSHITTNEGLPSNTIYAIKKDTSGFVWFTTDYNLYKFKMNGKKFIRYNIEPGIVNSPFSNAQFYTLKDGTWLTTSSTEIVSFQPYISLRNNYPEKVEIVGFKVFDDRLFVDSFIHQHKPVMLSYKQNFITVEYASLNFSNLQQPKYYYKLSGVNEDWVSADTKNFANYTNLDPGEYAFSVKMENDKGVSSSTDFSFTISPPFWQTWWFISICILLAASIIYVLFRRRIKLIQHEAAMKQRIAETEMMALRAQMNPHFIFNCLNSIDNLIQMNEKEKATSYLSKFARLIRSILENSKNNVVPCWKDIETLKLYLELEALRFDNKFSYNITVSDEIINGDYSVPPLVVQPFVENAIHHGLLNKREQDKKLFVDVSIAANHICYRIEDNGVGRTKAASYKQLNKPGQQSVGLQITTARINLFNQQNNGAVKIIDLYDTLNQPAGTRVEVSLIIQP